MAIATAVPVNPLVANPAAPTVTPQGAGGAVTYSYKIVAKGTSGQTTAASSAGSTATGNATLSVSNFNRVTWTNVAQNQGYDIYRTVSNGTPSSLGKIGSVGAGVTQFDDTGLAGDASSEPGVNTTGIGTPINGLLHLERKSLQVGGTFVATVQVKGSINGVDYENIGSAITTKSIVNIAETVQFLRVDETAYTSGAPTITLAGGGTI